MARVVTEHTQDWTPSLATDPVQQALLAMIKTKQKQGRRGTKNAPQGSAAT